MKMKVSLLAAIAISLSLLSVPSYVGSGHALPGLSLVDSNNSWAPYGPHSSLRNVLLKYYSADAAEYADFQNGGLDIADAGTAGTGPPGATWPSYDANQDFNMSAVQASSVWHGIYFNGANDVFGPDPAKSWGCDWQGYNSACGREMRQAFAHLIDRPAFAARNLAGGGGAAIWDDSPGDKAFANGTLFRSPASNFCTWDTINNTGCSLSTGPYNLAPDPSGFATPGSPDFCLAADHMIRALGGPANSTTGVLGNNLGIGKAAGTCILTGYSSNVVNNPLLAKRRSTNPRRSLGSGFIASTNALFGASVNNLQFGGISNIGIPIVFSEPPISPANDWSWYTYGYQATGPFSTFLYSQFSSQFAFDRADDVGFIPPDNPDGYPSVPSSCPATSSNPNPFPTNPTYICIPSLDVALLSAISTSSESTFESRMISALDIAGRNAVTLPEYALNVRSPALRTVIGLVNTRGLGYEGGSTFNTAHKGPYVPADSRYQFDGGGASDTLRFGQAQPTDFLNPFQTGTVWEFNNAFMIYDTVFASDPVTPSQVYCEMCRTYTLLSTTPNTIIDITLRDGMTFQNGSPVTAADVAFSYLNLRDFSSVLSGNLAQLQTVTLDPNNALHMTVTMTAASVGHLPNLSGVPVLPMALWQCTNSCHTPYNVGGGLTIPVVDPYKAGPGYDPIAAGTYIGSGLWECKSIHAPDVGTVGTGCTTNADGSRGSEEIPDNGSALFTVFDNTPGPTGFEQYTRSNNPAWGTGPNPRSGQLQEFIYADEFGNDTVTITDINHVASCIGSSQATTACPDYAYWAQPSALLGPGGTITINDYLIVFSHRFEGEVLPYSWTGTARQPGIGTLTNIVAWPGH